MRRLGLWLVLGLLALLLVACPAADTDTDKDITEIASDTATLSTLVSALGKADLVDALKADGPFTVFAPTNDAFAALLEAQEVADLDALIAKLGAETVTDILKYHVVAGEQKSTDLTDGEELTTLQGEAITVSVGDDGVTLNGSAKVTTADIEASNGVIHLIDAVILPPSLVPDQQDIVELAQATPSLSVLVEAVVAADLVDTLKGEGPFTVFAPTNDAFVALLEAQEVEDLEALIAKLGIETIAQILTYHVASGKVMSTDLSDGQMIPTVEGSDISVAIADGVVTLNGTADVITPDIEAANGVVHIIDAVLLPPAE